VSSPEWDSLDSYHAWTKSPEYPAIKQTAVDKVGPPSYDPTVPPLHIRHIDVPSSVLSNILACRVIETYTLKIPASLSLESARKDIDGFCRSYRDKLTELLVWNASKDDQREIIAVVGWDSVQQHLDAVRADWVQEASEKILGPMEKNYMVHWKMQDE
jgi:heme-degrading monooxygenase HmoA